MKVVNRDQKPTIFQDLALERLFIDMMRGSVCCGRSLRVSKRRFVEHSYQKRRKQGAEWYGTILDSHTFKVLSSEWMLKKIAACARTS